MFTIEDENGNTINSILKIQGINIILCCDYNVVYNEIDNGLTK